MTSDRLQSLALMLSRGGWARHWLHWNYPVADPWYMAIDVRGSGGEPLDLGGEMERSGFARTLTGSMDDTGECVIYTVRRTHPDGTPYTGADLPRPVGRRQ